MYEKRPEVAKDLPMRLRDLRNYKGWSQGQLAKRTGIDAKQISKYERGVSFPTVDIMVKLVTAYEISLDDLVFDRRTIDFKDIPNKELINRFDQISRLDNETQKALIMIMDGMIMKQQIEKGQFDLDRISSG